MHSCFTSLHKATLPYWLPVAQRIEYKVSFMCYDVVSKTAPPYLSDLLHLYIPSHSLCSLTAHTLLGFKNEKSSKGNALFPTWALSHRINLQQNPRSKLNSKPHCSSHSLSPWTKLLNFIASAANHTPTPALPPFPVDLPVSMRTCCMHACLYVRVCACMQYCACAVK